MRHSERNGRSKIVNDLDYPVTGRNIVDVIVTDLAIIERDSDGLVLRKVAPGFTTEEIQQVTEAPMRVDLW